MSKKILYVLVVTPKYNFDWDLYKRFREGVETKLDKDVLEEIRHENHLQRELIKDIINSEAVVEPAIVGSLSGCDAFFYGGDMRVYYSDDKISAKDQLNYLRYIGEELLPWVKEVKLSKREIEY